MRRTSATLEKCARQWTAMITIHMHTKAFALDPKSPLFPNRPALNNCDCTMQAVQSTKIAEIMLVFIMQSSS